MPRHQDAPIEIGQLDRLSRAQLRVIWKETLAETPPACLGRDVLALGIAYVLQERRYGGLTKPVARELDRLLAHALADGTPTGSRPRTPSTTTLPRTGTVLVREWQGATHHLTILNEGFLWNGNTYPSLSAVARAITGAKWNGPRFFGLREAKTAESRYGAK